MSRIGLGELSEYGNYVVIQHTDGKFSVLSHLSSVADRLEVGLEDKQTEVIAQAEDSGTIPDMGAPLHLAILMQREKNLEKGKIRRV